MRGPVPIRSAVITHTFGTRCRGADSMGVAQRQVDFMNSRYRMSSGRHRAPARHPGGASSGSAVTAALAALLLVLGVVGAQVGNAGTAAGDGADAEAAGVLGPNRLPQPGEVGFLGNQSSLRVIDSTATAPPGTTWSNNTLRVDGANVTLEQVWVKGSIDYYGSGTLQVRDSIVQANGSSWSIIMGRTPGARVDVRDSDLLWPSNVPAPGPTWGNGAVHGDASHTLIRNDISGTPDGVQQSGGDSTYAQNWIHDLRMYGSYPNNSHNDGMQFYEGANFRVVYNYIELNGYDGTHQNAAVFFSDDGGGTPSPRITGNYLSGGGYQLRLEDGTTQAIVTDNVFGPIDGGFGHASIQPGATVKVWDDNVDTNGNPVPQPPTR